jgi:hypothetical protein
VLGALAVSLPVLFHLIQRRPRGQMEFSSLMFLSPSPPRLSRRSRLNNLLLLFLRGLALVLLALAFARPFVRSADWLNQQPPDRRLLVLVDTSASMRRTGLWQRAQDEVRRVLDEARPNDDVAIYAFDSALRPLVSFDQTSAPGGAGREALLASAWSGVRPSHAATDLGQALSGAADILHTSEGSVEDRSAPPAQIIVVTDLQRGSDLESLRGFAWPHEIRVDVRQVTAPRSTNARAVVVADASPPPGEALGSRASAAASPWRVTVFNAADSVKRQFRLGWANDRGELVGEREYSVQVPPGGSRALRLSPPPARAEQLVLTGDDQTFDNSVYVAEQAPRKQEILLLGEELQEAKDGLFYYLSLGDFDNARRDVTVKAVPESIPIGLTPHEVPLIVLARPVSVADEEVLRSYVDQGGNVLVVLAGGLADAPAATQLLQRLTRDQSVRVSQARVRDYAMLADIDFSHAIFRPFSDPRFNDFTKIRFWSHRRIELSETGAGRVLARFDSHDPALIEFDSEGGRWWILAAGWQPDESQLALSSKFIPLLDGMIRSDGGSAFRENYWVGDEVTLPAEHSFEDYVAPSGVVHSLGDGKVIGPFDTPGVYRLRDGQEELPFAVNLALSESRTEPLDPSELEAYGVPIGGTATAAQIDAERRRLRDFELERSQRLWQWLLVGVLVVLALESWLAGQVRSRRLQAA